MCVWALMIVVKLKLDKASCGLFFSLFYYLSLEFLKCCFFINFCSQLKLSSSFKTLCLQEREKEHYTGTEDMFGFLIRDKISTLFFSSFRRVEHVRH